MKEKKLTDIFDQRMIKIIVIAINAVVLLFLIIYIISRIVVPTLKGSDEITSANTAEVEAANAEVENFATSDDSLSSIYNDLLAGMEFTVDDGTKFSFGAYGSYSGFFDDAHSDVRDYIYDVQTVGSDIMLNIYDRNKDSIVSYKMEFMTNGDIQLNYPDNNRSFILTTN